MYRNYCHGTEKQVQVYNVCGKVVHVGVRLKRYMWQVIYSSVYQSKRKLPRNVVF